MDRLRQERKFLRSKVTRVCNDIDAKLDAEEKNPEELQVRQTILLSVMNDLADLEQKFIGMLLDEQTDDETLEGEAQSAEDYTTKGLTRKLRLEKFFHPSSRSPSPSVYNTVSSASSSQEAKLPNNYKLPKIELPKYDGKINEWLSWWAQFKNIHEDKSIDASSKFHYLNQSLVVGSQAAEQVKNFPVTAENYPKAIKVLEQRFGDQKVLWKYYIGELIKLIENRRKFDIFTLQTQVQSQLRAINSLGELTKDDLLCPIIESCMAEEIMLAWQRSSNYGKLATQENPKSELDYLLEFLDDEVQRAQVRGMREESAIISKEDKKSSRGDSKKKAYSDPKSNEVGRAKSTVAELNVSSKTIRDNCIFCLRGHDSNACGSAKGMTLKDKESKIKEFNACFKCLLRGHRSKQCKKFVKCLLCDMKHMTVMCPSLSHSNGQLEQPASTSVHLTCSSDTILQTLTVQVVGEGGRSIVGRVLIDNGAMRSYIKKSTLEKLGLKPTGYNVMQKTLFGGITTQTQRVNKYEVAIRSTSNEFTRSMTFFEEKTICANLPKVPKGSWISELKQMGVELSDQQSKASEIDILLGSDNIPKIFTGNSMLLKSGLVATETKLGWTLFGEVNSQVKNDSLAMMTLCMYVEDASIPDMMWNLETLGIRDPIQVKTERQQEEDAKKSFNQSIMKTDGRYIVGLPWSEGIQDIPNNKNIAVRRLESTTNKLKSANKYEAYDGIFKSWLKEGFIEEVSDSHEIMGHYLPHRAVFKDSRTTPVRPVFDASCKVGRHPSLNDCLYKGPNNMELLPAVLLRFRRNEIGLIADIRKAFQMIEVKDDDRDYLRFLWWKDKESKTLIIFRHARVPFGLNCSPFLLQATIDHHLDLCEDDRKDIVENLRKCLYVDNCVTSVCTNGEYEIFREKSTSLLTEAGMELRLWERTGEQQIEDSTSTTNVLGYEWNKNLDTLNCHVPDFEGCKITRRTILSQISKIFDPIGFTGPALVLPKLIVQESWLTKLNWDDELPQNWQDSFTKWRRELPILSEIKIPRQAFYGTKERIQIHTFVDASQSVFAAVVFARSETSNGVQVQLLQAKSRTAPPKRPTIPRLELMSCLIGARLTIEVKNVLDLNSCETYLWTDSTTALAWIKRNDNWGTFVGNRVKEIIRLTNAEDWRHVPGIFNPADLPSRGCSPNELLESQWWEGPHWLKGSRTEWPTSDPEFDEDEIVSEARKTSNLQSIMLTGQSNSRLLTNLGSFSKSVKFIGWMRRFIVFLKDKSQCKRDCHLSREELKGAQSILLRELQQ